MVKVGIVDDKRFLLQSLKEQLGSYNEVRVVLTASNGEELIRSLKSASSDHLPEVVLVDIEMPVMNGIDTVCIASELFPEIHFIMLTVFSNSDKVFEAIKAGASGYLLKDEKLKNIVAAILEVKEGGAPMSNEIARKTLQLLKNNSTASSHGSEGPCPLTPRELDILYALVEGLNYVEIGDKLFISPHTVRKHISNIYTKLHVNNKATAIRIAGKMRWLDF